MALVVIYKSDSTLPWWSLVIAVLLGIVFILFLGALFAITGIYMSTRESPVSINSPRLAKAVNRNVRTDDRGILASWQSDGQYVLCSV
jgi:hypothetical protein